MDALADPAREFALTGAAAAAVGGALFTICAAVAAATGRGRGRDGAAPPFKGGVARPPPSTRSRRHRLTPAASAAAVAVLGVAWAAAGAAFLLAAPSWSGPAARGVYLAAAGACLVAGTSTTHGFGGRLRARALGGGGRAPGGGGAASWTFIQPGRGGPAFMLLQAGAWALVGASAGGLLALARLAVQAAPGGRALAAGCAATAAATAGGRF